MSGWRQGIGGAGQENIKMRQQTLTAGSAASGRCWPHSIWIHRSMFFIFSW